MGAFVDTFWAKCYWHLACIFYVKCVDMCQGLIKHSLEGIIDMDISWILVFKVRFFFHFFNS